MLPTIETPKYTLTVPSTKETVEFRPFLVKEEKILMIAQEANTSSSLLSAMKDVIKSCTFGKVDLYNLAMYDLEYILLQIRSKSVGETSDINVKCDGCDEYVETQIDLSAIDVNVNECNHDNNIKLTDEIGVILKEPGLKDAEKSARGKNANDLTSAISTVIESVFDGDNVYPFSEASTKEIDDFIDSLSSEQVLKINEWVNTIPSLKHDIEYTCPHCNHSNKKTLAGLADFFE